MSQNQYRVVKTLIENGTKGATVAQLARKRVENVPQVVYSLRQRGHTIITEAGKYFMPFGSRDQEAKLSKTEKAKRLKAFQLSV